ncbi:HipA domain-containing protein [Pseudorhodoferax sp. LjRoot39]|uniref:HipA domain-containing protein n=1 Tax=Pseudorhodoferax sp. LjRoot39 TaxID=3342328 RepID=UPI003ECC573E
MPTGASRPSLQERTQALERLLREKPLSAQALAAALGISQPTLSRAIQAAPELFTQFRVPGERTPQYACLRALSGGLSARQTVYRVTTTGAIEPFAQLEFLSGGATLERGTHSKTRLYGGLPPYMAFSAPSGFLGRQVAQSVASALHLPQSLKDWSDDHRIAYLFTRGLNMAGNLVYGDLSLQVEMDLRQALAHPPQDKLAHYVAMANALKEASFGSSAGGEQPKFLSVAPDAGHVIVKFARQGSRMADLLPLEHLALRALAGVDVLAAETQLLAAADYVFLEVRRFDRVGLHGRIGMLSAGSVDDEFFGARDTWSEFAARCVRDGFLSAADARRIDVMAAFSELIGNGDRHFENISLLIGEDGEYQGVAPAYDILPMRYAPIGAGVDPDLHPIAPRIGSIGAKPEVWARAAVAAQRFWTDAQQADLPVPIPRAFRELAARNLAEAQAFVAPLLPAAP